MNIEDTFYAERFDSSDLARKLYAENPGVVFIPNLLKLKVREILFEEIQQNRKVFVKAKENYLRAEQRFFTYYFGWNESGSNESQDFPLITQFSQAYDQLSKELVNIAELSQKRVSSTGIHVYWKDKKYGLSPHRDESPAQLIAIFVLDGYSPFYVADDHELKTNRKTFEAKPGSVILMRGPINAAERDLTKKGPNYNTHLDPRPIHCVGPVEKDRTVVVLRHVDESLSEVK